MSWFANQRKPDIAHNFRAVARVSHDPKERSWKAARKILHYLKGTAELRLGVSASLRNGSWGSCANLSS